MARTRAPLRHAPASHLVAHQERGRPRPRVGGDGGRGRVDLDADERRADRAAVRLAVGEAVKVAERGVVRGTVRAKRVVLAGADEEDLCVWGAWSVRVGRGRRRRPKEKGAPSPPPSRTSFTPNATAVRASMPTLCFLVTLWTTR